MNVRTMLAMSLLWTAALRVASGDSPTLPELRQAFDAGRYSEVIGGVPRALAARAEDADAPNRYELLTLRGEAFLLSGNAEHARQAFEDAFHAADDRERRAAAAATAALVRRSSELAYAPEGGREQPIGIVEPASRTKAMAALRQDLRTTLAPRVAEAIRGRTLPPMQALLPDLLELTAIEVALGGADGLSESLFAQVGGRARELIAAELRRKRQFLEANNGILYGMGISTTGNIEPRTIGSEDRKVLDDLAAYVGRIKDAAQRGRRVAQALSVNAEAWERIVADADDLHDRVLLILARGR